MGNASGWNVWPLENGDWAWRAWIAANGGTPRSGVEASESEAEVATQRALEDMLSDASAAAHDRRELGVPDHRGTQWDPQC